MATATRGEMTSSAADMDRHVGVALEVMTPAGVAYELQIPLGVIATLPRQGESVTLHTSLVVKEDLWQLFGFASVFERRLFQKLLTANGVGPSLALGLMSALSAQRLVRAIQEKDIPTLQGVPRVGRKKAERLILDLSDKLGSIGGEGDAGASRPGGGASEDSLRALVSLGYTSADAERGVRAALDADYYNHMAMEYRERRDLMVGALNEAGFKFSAPEGAYYILADFTDLSDLRGIEFAMWLAKEVAWRRYRGRPSTMN